MSFETLRWAEQQKVGNAHRKSVLMCLAQFADEAHSCYPGQATIAKATELGQRTVRRHVAALEADGFIERHRQHLEGRHGRFSDRYTLKLNRPTSQTQPASLAAKDPNSTGQLEQLNRPVRTTQPASDDTPFLIELPEELPEELPVGRKTKLPKDFQPNSTGQKLAEELGLSLADEVLHFVDHHAANGSRFVDWQAALRTWLRNSAKFKARGTPRGVSPQRTPPNGHKPYRNPTNQERYLDARI